MFVPCPQCGFLVALIVRPDGAPQRCPRCDAIVQTGAEQVVEEATPTSDTEPEAQAEAIAPSEEETRVGEDATTQAPSFDEAIAAATVGASPARTRRASRPRRKGAPSFARHAVAATPSRTPWGWYAAVAGLALLLALQLLLAQRQELAADPRWRPFVAGMCNVLQCELPPWREPTAFTMLQRSVRPKPGQTGVLAVEASFRNDARWPQPWPVLMLSLSDVDGRQVGQGAFNPDDYLRSQRAGAQLLPGQSATVSFDVIEPAPRIVAFTFDFR